MDYTGTDRQAKMRERRNAEGWKRVEVWVRPEAISPKDARERLIQYLREVENAGTESSDGLKLDILRANVWGVISEMNWE
jgi:hypothetical protein